MINENGEVGTVSIPIEPTVKDVFFTRKQLELPADVIASLIGEYISSVEGVAFSVTANREKVFITQTGGTPSEIIPFKIDIDTIGFKLKRTHIDFLRQNNSVTHLVLKTMTATLEARKRA